MTGLPKPESVGIGQYWWHTSMNHKPPLYVVGIEQLPGWWMSNNDVIVPWAVFSADAQFKQPCSDMLERDQWKFIGYTETEQTIELDDIPI